MDEFKNMTVEEAKSLYGSYTIGDFWGDTPGDKKAKKLLKSGEIIFCQS